MRSANGGRHPVITNQLRMTLAVAFLVIPFGKLFPRGNLRKFVRLPERHCKSNGTFASVSPVCHLIFFAGHSCTSNLTKLISTHHHSSPVVVSLLFFFAQLSSPGSPDCFCFTKHNKTHSSSSLPVVMVAPHWLAA